MIHPFLIALFQKNGAAQVWIGSDFPKDRLAGDYHAVAVFVIYYGALF
jgi:hypothetical protein